MTIIRFCSIHFLAETRHAVGSISFLPARWDHGFPSDEVHGVVGIEPETAGDDRLPSRQPEEDRQRRAAWTATGQTRTDPARNNLKP